MYDQNLINDWFDKYSNDIYHFLIYRVGFSDAEDLVQEVFIRAIKGVDSFQGDANPKTWLLSIARNVAMDEHRYKKRNMWKKFIQLERSNEPVTEDTPEAIHQFNEENLELYTAISSLKPKYRDVLILKGIQELSVKEIATTLNWTENKVRMTTHRAKEALKKELQGGMINEERSF